MDKRKKNRKNAKEIMILILEKLELEKEPITPNKLAKKTKISPGSILKYLDILESVTTKGRVIKVLKGDHITFWELDKKITE